MQILFVSCSCCLFFMYQHILLTVVVWTITADNGGEFTDIISNYHQGDNNGTILQCLSSLCTDGTEDLTTMLDILIIVVLYLLCSV